MWSGIVYFPVRVDIVGDVPFQWESTARRGLHCEFLAYTIGIFGWPYNRDEIKVTKIAFC